LNAKLEKVLWYLGASGNSLGCVCVGASVDSYSLNGLLAKFLFFFVGAMGHFDWPTTQKKIETSEASQNSSFFVRMEPLAHLDRWKGGNFGQRIWDKVRCYWEHIENSRNPLRIWKHDGNTRIKKFHLQTPPHPLWKKNEPSWVYVQLSHWLHAYSIPWHGHHPFLPRLIPLLQSTPLLLAIGYIKKTKNIQMKTQNEYLLL
jgi:hypothetical protein